ncbi:hypothetical protein MCOR14_003247 [Pyricularia oryzae]|nr:hypothetical protein MCOR14_003247 [Pyricularia oryzae]
MHLSRQAPHVLAQIVRQLIAAGPSIDVCQVPTPSPTKHNCRVGFQYYKPSSGTEVPIAPEGKNLDPGMSLKLDSLNQVGRDYY